MDPGNGTTQHGYRDITVSTRIPLVDGLSTGPSGFGVSQILQLECYQFLLYMKGFANNNISNLLIPLMILRSSFSFIS